MNKAWRKIVEEHGPSNDEERAIMRAIATPTPDIDPEEVRRALEFFDKSEWDPEDEQREMQGNVDACCAAAREWLRLREQPAPDEELPRRGGGTIGVGTLAYFQANNENQLQQAMLRRVIALEKALGRERARALLCERLGVEAESLGDLLCARSDLDAISDVMLAAGAMFDVGVEVLPDLSQQLPIHGPVRLPSMPIVPQPAPDVQAQVILDCGDNSCRFATNKGGMRTNGRCRCFENAGFGPSAVGAALKMLPEIARLRAQLAQIDATRGQTEKSLTDFLDRARDDEHQRIDAAVASVIEDFEMQIVEDIVPGWVSIPAVEWEAIRARSGA